MTTTEGHEGLEGLTREERQQYFRERRMEPFQDDPEMLEAIRTIPFDDESTPEEDEEDIRISRERLATGKLIPLEVVLRELAEKYPDEAEDLLSD